jgi:hypothetical protein
VVLAGDDEQPSARVLDLKSGATFAIDVPAERALIGWTSQGEVVWRVDDHDQSQLMIGKPGATAKRTLTGPRNNMLYFAHVITVARARATFFAPRF